MKSLKLILFGIFAASAFADDEDCRGIMMDDRDNKAYMTVTIGSQTWMAENLNYKTDGSYCYENKASNCKKYGRLYEWYAAKKACPAGWHLPSKAEFETLWSATSRLEVGKMLKSKNGWNRAWEENLSGVKSNGEDAFGFGVLPSAAWPISIGGSVTSLGIGNDASFWSYDMHHAYRLLMEVFSEEAYLDDKIEYDFAYSVRCLKD